MEIINEKGINEMIEEDELNITEMLLFEIAIQLEKLVLNNGKQ